MTLVSPPFFPTYADGSAGLQLVLLHGISEVADVCAMTLYKASYLELLFVSLLWGVCGSTDYFKIVPYCFAYMGVCGTVAAGCQYFPPKFELVKSQI